MAKKDKEEKKEEAPAEEQKEGEGEEEPQETEEERQKREAEEEKKRIEEEKAKLREEKAGMFEAYLQDSGLSSAFQLIFAEIVAKQISDDKVFEYAAARLRSLKKQLDDASGNSEAVAE